MNEIFEHIDCNLCGSSNKKILYKIKHFNPHFTMVKCKDCGLVYMDPRHNKDNLIKFYNESYYAGDADYSYADERLNSKSNSIIYKKRLSVIESYLKNKNGDKKILDIGCSFGGFLVAAREKGWETYGIEMSKYSANYAVNENKLNVQNASIENTDLIDNFYNAVNMVEVIEHLTDPLGSLKKIYESLRPNGVLLIQTANANSLKAKISGSRWEYFLPGHLYCFSRKTLVRMLEKVGFQIEKIYSGDELGIITKFKSIRWSKDSLLKKFIAIPIVTIKYYLRKIHFGQISVGGNVFIARKVAN